MEGRSLVPLRLSLRAEEGRGLAKRSLLEGWVVELRESSWVFVAPLSCTRRSLLYHSDIRRKKAYHLILDRLQKGSQASASRRGVLSSFGRTLILSAMVDLSTKLS